LRAAVAAERLPARLRRLRRRDRGVDLGGGALDATWASVLARRAD
jgi:hypothetical protein